MEQIHNEALIWLIKTEKIYDGVNRHEMKIALKSYVENCEKTLLEFCPLFAGLIFTTALRLLGECPDYN